MLRDADTLSEMDDDPDLLAVDEQPEPVSESRLFWWLMLAAIIATTVIGDAIAYGH